MKVSAQYEQEHFAEILTAIDTGEEVEVTRHGQPSVRLTLVVSNQGKQDVTLPPRPLGRLRGLIRVPAEEEWAEMDKELSEMMVDAPLTTDGDI